MSDGNVTLNVSVDPLVAYPIGSIYMSVNSTNPSKLFGGTWVALNEGRVLIGASTTHPAGETGGEETHTLTTSEMPSHNHSGRSDTDGSHSHTASTDSQGNHTHTHVAYPQISSGGWSYEAGGFHFGSADRTTHSSGSHSHGVSISSAGSHWHYVYLDNTGGGSAHNNMQPYLSVYMWKRTA